MRVSVAGVLVAFAMAFVAVACGDDTSQRVEPDGATESVPEVSADDPGDDLYPDVVDATVVADGEGLFTVSATLSSPYDTPARYADAWRVMDPGGQVLGERVLLHDHATEQPFTRSLRGVAIPDDVAEVTIQGRDRLNGWGGATVTVPVPSGG